MKVNNDFEKGRLAEAEITLGNMYRILDEMTEVANKNSHIHACISDLEKDLGMSRKDFEL